MINMRIDKSPNVVTLKSAEPEKGVDMSPSLEGIPIFKEFVVNQNSGENNIKFWTGTIEEYNLIEIKSADTLYFCL